jgi:hypothetical protein
LVDKRRTDAQIYNKKEFALYLTSSRSDKVAGFCLSTMKFWAALSQVSYINLSVFQWPTGYRFSVAIAAG